MPTASDISCIDEPAGEGDARVQRQRQTVGGEARSAPAARRTAADLAHEGTSRMEVPFGRRDDQVLQHPVFRQFDAMQQTATRRIDPRQANGGRCRADIEQRWQLDFLEPVRQLVRERR